MTSLSLHCSYDQADGDYPVPRYGHPKDRRPDLLQVQAGIAAARDGGIIRSIRRDTRYSGLP